MESINEQLNLAHYWIIVLKYKRILFVAPFLFALLGFFIALNINPTFRSQATLVIEESTKNIGFVILGFGPCLTMFLLQVLGQRNCHQMCPLRRTLWRPVYNHIILCLT